LADSFILLNCKKNREKNVIAHLREVPEVKEIQCVTGPYDLLVKVEASTFEDLHEAVTWKIRKLKNVRPPFLTARLSFRGICFRFIDFNCSFNNFVLLLPLHHVTSPPLAIMMMPAMIF